MSANLALKAVGDGEHAGTRQLVQWHPSASQAERNSGSSATPLAGKRGWRLHMIAASLLLLALTAGLLRAPFACRRHSLLTSFQPGRCTTLRVQPAGGMKEKAAPLHQAPPQQQAALHPWLQPSQESFDRLKADPGLALREPGLLAEFQAAPWLLPPDTAKLLPYTGVHDLDRLLALRAAPAGGHPSTVVLLPFNRPFAVMVQNCVYTLAKLGGATNYLVFTWTASDLAACSALNLPCADVAALLAAPLQLLGDSQFGSRDFNLIQWLKAHVTLRALRAGHVTMLTDADVAYVAKPVWPAFARLLNLSSADGVFQGTGGTRETLNTGTLVVLPTPGGTEAVRRWAGMATGKFSEQYGLGMLRGRAYRDCSSTAECLAVRKNMTAGGPPALFRWFPSAQSVASGLKGNCALADPKFAGRINPCDWSVLFLHPVCAGRGAKPIALERQGLWLLQDAEPDMRAGCLPWDVSVPVVARADGAVPVCRPRRWRQHGAEDRLYGCPAGALALVPPTEKPP